MGLTLGFFCLVGVGGGRYTVIVFEPKLTYKVVLAGIPHTQLTELPLVVEGPSSPIATATFSTAVVIPLSITPQLLANPSLV